MTPPKQQDITAEAFQSPSILASAKTFDTYELLESILLHLPLSDLLLSQAVCQRWRDLHADSCRIQTALFKKPIDKDPIHVYRDSDRDDDNNEDVDYDLFLALTDIEWPHTQSRPQRKPTFNPFLPKLVDGNMFANPSLDRAKDKTRSFTNPQSSWRGMQMAQPAIAEVWVGCSTKFGDPRGITVGELTDFLSDGGPSVHANPISTRRNR